MTAGILIDNPTHIRQLLRSLVDQRMLVQVQPLDKKWSDTTMLLAFAPKRGLLIFDEPRATEHGIFSHEQPLHFTSQHRGIEIEFTSVSRGIRTFEERPALFTGWPDALHYLQRRKAFRMSIPKTLESRAELQMSQRFTIPARLLDISSEGFGVAVDRNASLREGEVIDCWLDVGDEFFSGSAEVKNFKMLPGRMVRVGAQFLDQQQQQKRRLGQLVRQLERQSIRTRS